MSTMEGIVLATAAFESTVGFVGGLVLLAIAVGAFLLGYIAHEEAKGRRIDWLEEPLATPQEFRHMEDVKLAKAA
ncbi:MAG: hypothetical protein L0170_16685 [Acidobacteria bacterium]|nr:hypothetical protein [Acidobacteriota bacterium]